MYIYKVYKLAIAALYAAFKNCKDRQLKMEMPTYEEIFKQIKTNFWLSGIPFNETKSTFRYYVLLITIDLMIVEESLFLISKRNEDLLVLTQLAPCCCIGLLSVLKILPLAAKKEKIFKLTDCLDGLYTAMLNDKIKRNLVGKDVILVKTLMKYFFILNVLLISVYNFSTLAFMAYDYFVTKTVVFHLPYDVVVPFPTDLWLSWFVVYIHSIICGFICVLFFTTVDASYCVMTSHICNNFAIVSDELQNLKSNDSQRLKNIAKSHQYILELSEDLEDVFNLPNLFNVLVGSLEICALGFNLTMGDWTQIPGCVLFLSSVLLQILMMSIFGENLIRESIKVGEAAYNCDWYNMDIASRKTILCMMTRSHKPATLTAYKFSIISYGSFTKIIRNSWSYFTLIKTVYNPDS